MEASGPPEQTYMIFCYGSNGPKQLSERVETPYGEIQPSVIPAEARGWKRVFSNKSSNWEGASPANIVNTGEADDCVQGLIVPMSEA